MGFEFIQRGSFDKTDKFLNAMQNLQLMGVLDKYGAMGTAALAKATPHETGLTAHSWSHRVEGGRGGYSIIWSNSHMIHGTNIAIILQYGHGTGTGGYVAGRDYINPAMKPIFDKIADEVWKVVTKS
jgi:hypothetical protein